MSQLIEAENYFEAVEEMKEAFGLCQAWPFCQYHGCMDCDTQSMEVKLPTPPPFVVKGNEGPCKVLSFPFRHKRTYA